MNAKKILASVAIAGGLAAGALGVSTGVASADAGQGHGSPVPASWATDHNDHGQWNGDHGRGDDWNHGYGGGWQNGGGWNNGGYNGGPFPGGWNGGWEPNGGICLGPFCV